MASQISTISLPGELWHKIFDNLSGAELYAMGRVNQELRLYVLDYMQRNFRIPEQNSSHAILPFERIFQEASREVASISSSSSSPKEVDLVNMTSDERLDLISAANKKIAALWKRRGYDMKKLPPSPPFRLEEYQELQMIAITERERILANRHSFNRICLATKTPMKSFSVGFISSDSFYKHFVNNIYPRFSEDDKEVFRREIKEMLSPFLSFLRNRSTDNPIINLMRVSGIDAGIEEIIRRSVNTEHDFGHNSFQYETIVHQAVLASAPLILRFLYSGLSEEEKTALKNEIFITTMLTNFDGKAGEHFTQHIIDDATCAPHTVRRLPDCHHNVTSVMPSDTALQSQRVMGEAARSCEMLMAFKSWDETPEEIRSELFSAMLERGVNLPSEQWLMEELVQKFMTLAPEIQVSKFQEILEWCNHSNPATFPPITRSPYDAPNPLNRILPLARRLYDALDPKIQSNIRYNIFVINGKSMDRSTQGVGGRMDSGYCSPRFAYPEEVVTTTDLGRYVIEKEFTNLIVLEAVRRTGRWLRKDTTPDPSDQNPMYLYRPTITRK